MASDVNKRWVYSWSWHERDRYGAYREFGETFVVPDLGAATRAHRAACAGLWVKPHMCRPYVSALLEEHRDLDAGGNEVGRWRTNHEVVPAPSDRVFDWNYDDEDAA